MGDNKNVSMTIESMEQNQEKNEDTTHNVTEKAISNEPNRQQETHVSVPKQVLDNLKNLLDILGGRGVFKTHEMQVVGTIYNSLVESINTAS